MELKDLLRQHGKSVALVFKRRGIKLPVNSGNLVLSILHEPDLVDEISAQVAMDDQYSAVDGDSFSDTPTGNLAKTKVLTPISITAHPKAKTVKGTLTDILTTIASGLGTYIGAKKAAQGGTFGGIYGGNSGTQDPPATATKHFNWMLIGGIAIIVILLITLVSTKHHK